MYKRQLRLRDGQVLFAKSGGASALPLFEVEAEALEALHAQADASFLVVPQPIALAALPHGAVLLLPWLDLEAATKQPLAGVWPCCTSRRWPPAQLVSAGTGMASSALGLNPVGGVMTGDRPS